MKGKVGILAAGTGNGHISVARALQHSLAKHSVDAQVFESFYEDLMVSNKIISDYYNFLMAASPSLCCRFSELSYLTRPDLSEDFYRGVKGKLKKFIVKHAFDVIISTSHTINYAVIRMLKELSLEKKTRFYIVVTDPFVPISVGFDVKGADGYFYTNNSVKQYLAKNIEEKYLYETAYPVHEKFLKAYTQDEVAGIYKKLKLDPQKKTLLINSGSRGGFHYKEYLKEAISRLADMQIIFGCGSNEALFSLVNMIAGGEHKNVIILKYIENMNDILKISDIVLTKPGANSFYECLYLRKPLLLDKMEGFLYQEKGAEDFIRENKVGIIIDNPAGLSQAVREVLGVSHDVFLAGLNKIKIINGADEITNQIITWAERG